METFTPSLDWGKELWWSPTWIVMVWVAAAVGTLVFGVLICTFTTWGKQFWRITGAYFTGPGSLKVWLWLGAMLLSVVAGVRLDVLLSYQGSDMMTSFQVVAGGIQAGSEEIKQSGRDGFYTSMVYFTLLATIHVARLMLDLFLAQRFMLAWRAWLTDRLTGDWLDGRAYYRARFIDDTIDNPDQRIQADIDVFTTGVGPFTNTPSYGSESTLLFGAISSIVSMGAFALILWDLSNTLTIPGLDWGVPKALFILVIFYVLFATIIAFWIGRPIIGLSFMNEKFNAAFRYALVRLRDASEAVAFYRGENAERGVLRQRFDPVVANYKRYIGRTIGFNGWNLTMSQIIVLPPYLLQFPRFYAGELPLGAMTQSASAFGSIQSGLSFFRNVYDYFAAYRAAIIRLHGLVVANEEGRALPTLANQDCFDGTISLEGVEVRTPDGRQLISDLDLSLQPGEAMMITGPSGTGKTTLLRSLAQLWPFTTGILHRPGGVNETLFLSQMPYVPLGDLRTVVAYPLCTEDVDEAELRRTLADVALPNLIDRLDEVQDWAKVLSPGEQQRIAFARVLLTKPKAVFLDESTSALDEGVELTVYRLVRERLPNTILVSVSHRATVERHHTKELQLFGNGGWFLGAVGEEPVNA